ncbi:MAG: rhamnulokinase [Clostridia bacterium]|nr:rhamnulokinase [Clostridia bacterium]
MADLKMLAIDLGASSGRGIIGRFDGRCLVLEENHRFSNDPVQAGSVFSWDILRILHEIKTSILNCMLSEDKDIRSIAIDTWGVDYGLLDGTGRLIGSPVHYRDPRTEYMPEELFKLISREAYYGICGIQIVPLNTIFQLLAEKRTNPELLAAAKHFLFVPDLLNYFLTGNKMTEYTIASTSGLLDARCGNWSGEVLDLIGIDRSLFGEISQPGSEVGLLTAQLREELGCRDAKVLLAPSHDTASAVLAVPAKGSDFVYISSGTWSLMGAEFDSPCLNEKAMSYNFTNEGGAGGKIRFLKNIMGLWLEQESRRQWAREGEKLSFNELTEMAKQAKPLACFIDPDAPDFVAPGNMPGRIREFCRRTGQHVPETKGEVVRCIFDSLAMKYRQVAECIDDIKGVKSHAINIVGGGTKEEMLCQLAADASGRAVYAGPVEATAIGNLSSQAIAAGELSGISEAREMIAESFEIKCYEPNHSDMWDEAYERFLSILGK